MTGSHPDLARSAPDAPPPGRRGVVAWCLYDWANSAFPTVIITFVFAAYFTKAVAVDVETGTGQWALAMSLSGLGVALCGPFLGAIADRSGRRKPWILAFTLISITAGAALWTVAPDQAFVARAMILAGLANWAFELGQAFYNAMLPDLAPKAHMGRVSGWAWAAGYAGGLACLAVCLVLFVQPDPPLFGLDPESAEQIRITGPFVALWYLAFAWPLFLLTPDRPSNGLAPLTAARQGIVQLIETLKAVRRYGNIFRYLIARMIYIDGLNTLFAFGGIYAAGSFGMDFEEILLFGVLLNVTAGLGAAAFAWIDDWLGPKRTIILSLIALTGLGAAILIVETKLWFYILGCALGVFIGPVQSASRSMMAHLAPSAMRAEMFGLYALSGRATAFLGPALVGAVTVWMQSQRLGMAVILVFFVLGLLLLLPVQEPRREAN